MEKKGSLTRRMKIRFSNGDLFSIEISLLLDRGFLLVFWTIERHKKCVLYTKICKIFKIESLRKIDEINFYLDSIS